MKLVGNVAVVTGASQGIGYAIADYLMALGADVAICAPAENEVTAAARELEAANPGRRALAVAADVTNAADIDRLFDAVEQELGALSIVVNNAGASTLDRIVDLPEDDWDRIVDINLKGTFLGTKAAIRRMAASGTAGAIVNIGSIEVYGTTGGNAHYTASKAGILKFSQVAAAEAGAHGIRVNSVSPGIVMTPLTKANITPASEAAWRRTLAVDRFGEPADIAKAVAFLSSDHASWITGVDLLVDGGSHLRGVPDFVELLLSTYP
jgi:3-oxoacyl-[acyl-carrier protein] reductase